MERLINNIYFRSSGKFAIKFFDSRYVVIKNEDIEKDLKMKILMTFNEIVMKYQKESQFYDDIISINEIEFLGNYIYLYFNVAGSDEFGSFCIKDENIVNNLTEKINNIFDDLLNDN